MANCVTITLLLWASLAAHAQLAPPIDASAVSLSQPQLAAQSGREFGLKQWSIQVQPSAAAGWMLLNMVVMLSGVLLLALPRARRTNYQSEPARVQVIFGFAADPIRGP